MKIYKIATDNKTLFFFLSICFLIYSYIAVISHNHFQTFGWDLGFFDQLIWKISRGMYPISDLSKVNLLAGHFSPILFLFAPLYWLWSDVRVLLIAQAFLVVFAAYPLYLLSLSKTKSKLFSFAIIFSYLFFLGTQWSILNEFHEMAVAPFFIALSFLALEKNKKTDFLISIIGLLMTKEELAILVAAFGLMLFIYHKRKKEGTAIFIFSLVFFFFLTNFFMPAISEKGTYQHTHLSSIAKTPGEFLLKIITEPMFMFKSLVTPPAKINTLVSSLLSFGLLPLFAPLGILLPLIEQFTIRFLYTGPQYTFWQNVNHHAAPVAMLLPVSCVYAATSLLKKCRLKKEKALLLLSSLLFLSTICQDIWFKGPVHSLLKRQFYADLPWMKDNRVIITEIKKLSPQGSIAVQNSLYPHLSNRKNIYLLPEIKEAEYLVVDLHNGPNKYAPLRYEQMMELINKLLTDGQFTVYKQQGEAMILERKKL